MTPMTPNTQKTQKTQKTSQTSKTSKTPMNPMTPKDQTKIHLGFNILQNISRKELTKLQLQILPELQLQNLDQTFCSKSELTLRFLTKPRLPNLQQIVTNTIIISNSYNINK